MARFKHKYTFTHDHGVDYHTWTCIGRRGGLVLNINTHPTEWSLCSGGLELHYRQPPDYMADQAPSHERCHVTGGPCWHDGTSLYVEEVLAPYWKDVRGARDEHAKMFWRMEIEYMDRFKDDGEVLNDRA